MNTVKVTFSMVTVFVSIVVLNVFHQRLYKFTITRIDYESDKIDPKFPSSTKRTFETPMRHIPLDEIYKDILLRDVDSSIEYEENRKADMINTPGCCIPVAMVDYKKSNKKRKRVLCGQRAVFLKRKDTNKVRVIIKEKIIRRYLRREKNYYCCYRFIQRSTRPGFEHKKIQFSICKIIKDKETILLEEDFINILCFENNVKNITQRIIYDDIYAFCKRINITNVKRCGEKYNVLLLGMDSMSLPRIVHTMTRTTTYLNNKFWPSFRGYHKVGDNTLPNIMAAFTGYNFSTIVKSCSDRMDQCNDMLIWSKFREAGYVTAYGEDHLKLPDVFSRSFSFRRPPTDHYMRTFFLKGEHEKDNKSLICAGQISSGQQLLDYAIDFVLTYKDDPHFGFFWMNSFSHNINNHPEDVDKMFENFFNRLAYTGALETTFVIFFSDHGIRFGEKRLQVESYYDERMPFLFIWSPRTFKMNYPDKLKSMVINQFRLVTPYDLFQTLQEINELSRCDRAENIVSDSKHQSSSIFSVISPNRSCQDVGIHDKWCSCHKLYPTSVEDTEGIRSVHFVVSQIKSIIKSIKTKQCWACTHLSLKNVTRTHFYYDKDKVNLYYLVAFSMTPKDVYYEATVIRKDFHLELVGTVSIISAYDGFGDCTIRNEDKNFCVCQPIKNCRITSTL